MAKFKIGDIVDSKTSFGVKAKGEVKYVACQLATPTGGKTCDKKTCVHQNQEYVWVKWPNSITLSIVHENDLAPANQPAQTQPADDKVEDKQMTGQVEPNLEAIKDKFAEIKDKLDKVNGQKTIEQVGGWDAYNGFVDPQTGARRR